jgi:hypothetical protein
MHAVWHGFWSFTHKEVMAEASGGISTPWRVPVVDWLQTRIASLVQLSESMQSMKSVTAATQVTSAWHAGYGLGVSHSVDTQVAQAALGHRQGDEPASVDQIGRAHV